MEAPKHAILGPSGSHRWLVCTPSARFEEQIPEETSAYAEEGTLAHELAALELELKLKGVSYVKAKREEIEEQIKKLQANDFYCAEMQDAINEYVEVCSSVEGTHYIEHTFSLEPIVPLSFGTSDHSVIDVAAKKLYVDDFKYGKGVKVLATGNSQGMLYAIGALMDLDKDNVIETIEIRIVQPRAGGTSRWGISVEELRNWADTIVKPQANLAIAGQGEFKAGDHCRFCKAKNICRAYYNHFDGVLSLRDTRELNEDELAAILLQAKPIKSWLEDLEKDALRSALGGNVLPGFKVVPGRGSRSYSDEDIVIEKLIAAGLTQGQIFDTKIRALTNIEKELGKKKFNELLGELIVTREGGPTLVPDEDKRPEFNDPKNDFNDGFKEAI